MLAKSIVSFTVLASAVLASNFFVHEDVLAHPLYSIQLGQNPISNSTAQHLLEGELAGQSESPNPTQQLQRSMQSEEAYTHLLMKSKQGQTYLCRIPVANSTTGDDKEDENEELDLSDAERKERGLQLLAPLYRQCIYAWPRSYWAYEYCHLQHIKQFHAPANSVGHVYSPGNDPENKEFVGGVQFVLGRFNGDQRIPTDEVAEANNKEVLLQTEVHTFGQRSYLSQKWSFGDKCDLTGRPREVNIQFHCSMQSEDEIVSVHEFATCEYQMVIATPRLCQDVAFVPRVRKDVHRIECDPIVSDSQYNEIEESRPQDPSKEGVQVIFNKAVKKKVEPNKGQEEKDEVSDAKGGDHADELESKMAALKQELVDTLGAETEDQEPKAPTLYLLDAEFLNGMSLEDFMSNKNLEQQLEEITRVLLDKAAAAAANKPIPTKQNVFGTRAHENLKAYKQKFEDAKEPEEEEKNKEEQKAEAY